MFLFVTLTSCQKEDLSSLSAQENSSQSKIEVKELFADDITNHYFLQKNLSGLYPPNLQDGPFPNTFPENQVYSAEIISFNEFIVKEDYAIEIDMEYITTYTFNVEDSRGLLESDFANLLIIEEKGTEEIFNLFVQYYNWEEHKENNEVGLLYSYHLIMEDGEFYPPLNEPEIETMARRCNDTSCPVCYDQNLLEKYRKDRSYKFISWVGGNPHTSVDDLDNDNDERLDWLDPGQGGTGRDVPTIIIDDDPVDQKTPCDNLQELADIMNLDNDLSNKIKELLNKRTDTIEHGFSYDSKGRFYDGHSGTPTDMVMSHHPEKTIWAFHIHPKGSIFSIKDFYFYVKLLKQSDQSLNNVNFVAFTNSDYHYMFSFEGDENLFKYIFNHPNPPIVDEDTFKPEDIKDLYLEYNIQYSMDSSFFHILENHIFTSPLPLDFFGLRLVRFKTNEDGTEILEGHEIKKNVFGSLDLFDC